MRDDATPCSLVPNRDIFTSTNPSDIAQARAVCATCPFTGRTGPCLKAAIELGADGIWAGTTKSQRLRYGTGPIRKPGRPRKPIEHGTKAGYETHRRRNEDPCGTCKQAIAQFRKAQRERKRQQQRTAA